MSSKVATLRQALSAATQELDGLVDQPEKFDAKMREVTDLNDKIERQRQADLRMAELAQPAGTAPADDGLPQARDYSDAGDEPRSVKAGDVRKFNNYVRQARRELGMAVLDQSKHFRSLGDQLSAVARDALARKAGQSFNDSRLVRAPTGASEVDPTGGGYLLQPDFAEGIFMQAHDMGEILGRVNKIPISANSNSLKIRGIDETSRATGSRWGGVQSYWTDEGNSVTPSKPKFRVVEFSLNKLFSVMYMTDELLQDAPALGAIAGQAFSEEIMFMTEDAIFEGTGAGQPLGIKNLASLITVGAEKGQTAATITKGNIDAMWSRMWARSRKNAVWLMNQDAEPQLAALNGPVGTGGDLVYMPPGGLSAAPYATLKGRPILTTEYNDALGTPGDLMLVDLSQYTLVDKGGVRAETSMHVAFLTDEMVFRITYRCDGKSPWHAPMAPFKGTLTKSPFVALAQR